MKKGLLFLIFALVFICSVTNSAAQLLGPFQLGDDPGDPDTLYFVAGPPCSSDGDTLYFPRGGGDVTIYINIWNDDSLKGIAVPLVDLAYGYPSYAYLDSAKNNGAEEPLCFVGSRVEYFGAAQKLPHLSVEIKTRRVAGRSGRDWEGEFDHGPSVLKYLVEGGPEYVLIIPDWTSFPEGMERIFLRTLEL